MNLLHTLTQAADEEQLRLRPLPEHAAAAQKEHLRQHYALLLAALLSAQPMISEPQTRLLRLLLDALKLGDIRASLFEQARALTPESLVEAARLIRKAGYAQHLVVDALVLLRLDAQLTDEAAGMVGELGAFLGLDAAALATRADDAADILGLDTDDDEEDDGEGEDDDKDKDDDEENGGGSVLAELWPSCLSQPLTAAALRGGLQGGLWLLDADLAVHFPWQADKAVLVFRNGATLNTFAKEGAIALTACRLADAALAFGGNCSIALKGCDWQGDYDSAAKRTALESIGQDLTVTDCRFATRQARAILVQDAALTLTASRFTQCGHAALNGGAVWHNGGAVWHKFGGYLNQTIDHCHFERCLAARGGAIYADRLYEVRHCEFSACASVALQGQQAGDIAVYATRVSSSSVVSDCVFRQTSLNIGDAGHVFLDRQQPSSSFSSVFMEFEKKQENFRGYGGTFVRVTQFQQGNVYYHNKNPKNTITSDCSFAGGSAIDRQFK